MKTEHFYKAFVLVDREIELENFKAYQLSNGHYLYVSPDYDVTEVHTNHSRAIILGYIMDTRDGIKNKEDILKDYLDSENRLDEADYFNGRYALIIDDEKEITISTDAAGQRPVFYHETQHIVSSHEVMVKQVLEKNFKAKTSARTNYIKGLLDETRYIDIFRLNGSSELEVTEYSLNRIFPRKNFQMKGSNEIVQELEKYILETNKWLRNVPNKRMSLTGGFDSRTTLAAVRPIVNDINFFTYLKPMEKMTSSSQRSTYEIDENIVKDITNNIPISHNFFMIERKSHDEDYYKRLKGVVSSSHSYPLSKYFSDTTEYHGALHIKSTVHSVAKLKFPIKLYNESFEHALKIGFKRLSAKIDEENTDGELRLKAFLNRTNFNESTLKGYNVLDMLFLESRIGNFQSIITQETDNTMEVFNYFNTRRIISLLVSNNLEERNSLTIFSSLIDSQWPLLKYFGLNNDENLLMKYNALQKSIMALRTNVTRISNWTDNLRFEYDLKSHTNKLQPKDIPILKNEGYRLTILNSYDEAIRVKLKTEYSNEKGRGSVKIRIGKTKRDILDLNEGKVIILQPGQELGLEYEFSSNKDNSSWLRAATLYIELV